MKAVRQAVGGSLIYLYLSRPGYKSRAMCSPCLSLSYSWHPLCITFVVLLSWLTHWLVTRCEALMFKLTSGCMGWDILQTNSGLAKCVWKSTFFFFVFVFLRHTILPTSKNIRMCWKNICVIYICYDLSFSRLLFLLHLKIQNIMKFNDAIAFMGW